MQFQFLRHAPMGTDINRLDNGDGIEATLMRHQAFWHKTCLLKFNQTKLDRLHKKVVLVEDPLSMQAHSSQSKVYIELKYDICLFYDISLLVLRFFIMLPPMILTEKFVGVH